jgi:hypothetical protein
MAAIMAAAPVAAPLAYAIDELPFGRTKAYAEIGAGRLNAVKLGSRTLILADELRRYLESLPAATTETMRPTASRRRKPQPALAPAIVIPSRPVPVRAVRRQPRGAFAPVPQGAAP